MFRPYMWSSSVLEVVVI